MSSHICTDSCNYSICFPTFKSSKKKSETFVLLHFTSNIFNFNYSLINLSSRDFPILDISHKMNHAVQFE